MNMFRWSYFDGIREIEVEKKSASSVWYKNERGKVVMERLYSDNASWHDTYRDAYNAGLQWHSNRVFGKEESLKYVTKAREDYIYKFFKL